MLAIPDSNSKNVTKNSNVKIVKKNKRALHRLNLALRRKLSSI